MKSTRISNTQKVIFAKLQFLPPTALSAVSSYHDPVDVYRRKKDSINSDIERLHKIRNKEIKQIDINHPECKEILKNGHVATLYNVLTEYTYELSFIDDLVFLASRLCLTDVGVLYLLVLEFNANINQIAELKDERLLNPYGADGVDRRERMALLRKSDENKAIKMTPLIASMIFYPGNVDDILQLGGQPDRGVTPESSALALAARYSDARNIFSRDYYISRVHSDELESNCAEKYLSAEQRIFAPSVSKLLPQSNLKSSGKYALFAAAKYGNIYSLLRLLDANVSISSVIDGKNIFECYFVRGPEGGTLKEYYLKKIVVHIRTRHLVTQDELLALVRPAYELSKQATSWSLQSAYEDLFPELLRSRFTMR